MLGSTALRTSSRGGSAELEGRGIIALSSAKVHLHAVYLYADGDLDDDDKL